MNTRDLENAILLRESGELSPDQAAELDRALEENSELRGFAEASRTLQRAGREASRLTVPDLPELSRERILQQARAPSRRLPHLLAVAALLVLALGVWPHLSGLFSPDPDPLTAEVEPVRKNLAGADPLLEDLERLDLELAELAEADPESGDFVQDADYWAGVLLAMEDSI